MRYLSLITLLYSFAIYCQVSDDHYYLSKLSGKMAGRPLTSQEQALIATDPTAKSKIIDSWLNLPDYPIVFRSMVEQLLTTSGKNNEIDLDLPGNLAQYIASNSLPYTELLTASYCVSDNMSKIGCDTGAPYTSGVLTTRAFMAVNAGRFNLSRASTLMKGFACQEYPLADELQPRIEAKELIDLFQTKQATNQNDAFGNGLACYSCHSQFGQHAQFFVNFNKEGRYIASANGLQLPDGDPGVSFNNSYVSHFRSGSRASNESSNIFGVDVSNLADAAEVVSENGVYYECAVQHVLTHFLEVTHSDVQKIDKSFFKLMADEIVKNNPKPTMKQIIKHVLTHPAVVQSIIATRGSI